jgi:HupE / UreJ protein
MREAVGTCVLLALLCGARAASAHGLNTSYIDIAIEASRLSVTCLLSAEEIVTHFPVGVGAEGGRRPQDLDAAMQAAFAFLEEHLSLTLDGKKGALGRKGHQASPTGTFVRLELGVPLKRAPADITIEADAAFFERFGAQHISLVKVTLAEGPLQQTAITSDRPRASFVVGYRSLPAQCAAFIKLGIEHIFLGYDHIVFLFALIVIGGRLGQLIKIVTAFTVGHSVTLFLAALQVVSLPSRLIEGSIALTIAYVAFDNFFAAPTAHRWVLTFGFGLIHGFGFANVLREMHLPTSGLVPTLLSFNTGVEIGQVIIAAVLFPATLWLAKQRFRRPVVLTASAVVFIVGVGWFVQRAFDLSFMPI